MNPVDLIIFDCDGTLVDTERVGNQVLIECIRDLGVQISLDEALASFAGRKMADTLTLVEEKLGQPLPGNFLEFLREQMYVAFQASLEPMAGVPDLLKALQGAGIPVCVASNGPQEKMEVSLEVTSLLPYFRGKLFSGYDCGSWKPDPAIFLYAAERMGFSAERCIVVEDSIFGVQAAQKAGMRVFGYAPGGSGVSLEKEGARIFRHMDELVPLLIPNDFNPLSGD